MRIGRSVYDSMEISFHLEEREEETSDGEKVVAFFQKVKEADYN